MNIFLENIYNLSFFFNTGIGIFSFVCIYILIVLLILPASWLSLLSGFLYGSYLGSIIVFISASIGASFAFFVSKRFFSFFAKKLFDTKKATDAPMEAEMKTIIDPKYEPYKKPDNKDNQEAGSINKTIKI